MRGAGRAVALALAVVGSAACSGDGEVDPAAEFCGAVRAHAELEALGAVGVDQDTADPELEVRRRMARFATRTTEVDADLQRLAPDEIEADVRLVTEYELAYVDALRAADYDLAALVWSADGDRLRQLAPPARDAASRIDAVTERDCDTGFETMGEDLAAAPVGPDPQPDRPAPTAPPEPPPPRGPLPTGPADAGPGPGTEGPADPPPPPAPAEPEP